MRPLTTLAAALLIAAPLFAADAPKTDNPQTRTAAPQDSPLVAAAKRAAKARTGKTIVITNATLAKNRGAGMTTTESQPPITLPSPDAALIAMEQKASQPQANSGQTARQSPAEERQRLVAARAEENGPYSDNPQGDEIAIAATQNPSPAMTDNPSAAQTQNPATGQAQSPDQMHKKP